MDLDLFAEPPPPRICGNCGNCEASKVEPGVYYCDLSKATAKERDSGVKEIIKTCTTCRYRLTLMDWHCITCSEDCDMYKPIVRGRRRRQRVEDQNGRAV
jgi:hypothetical protein